MSVLSCFFTNYWFLSEFPLLSQLTIKCLQSKLFMFKNVYFFLQKTKTNKQKSCLTQACVTQVFTNLLHFYFFFSLEDTTMSLNISFSFLLGTIFAIFFPQCADYYPINHVNFGITAIRVSVMVIHSIVYYPFLC